MTSDPNKINRKPPDEHLPIVLGALFESRNMSEFLKLLFECKNSMTFRQIFIQSRKKQDLLKEYKFLYVSF